MSFFRYLLRLRRYERKSVEVGVFSKGVGHFERRFQREGASPTNHYWYRSSRVIARSCGIKISAVPHLVLSQSTRVTDGRTDGQNYDSQDRPRICSRGKNEIWHKGSSLGDEDDARTSNARRAQRKGNNPLKHK